MYCIVILTTVYEYTFSNNEKKLLVYVSANYFICSLAYYLLSNDETFNLVYIYIIYELVTFLLTRFFKIENTDKFIINQFGLSFLFIIFLYLLTSQHLISQFKFFFYCLSLSLYLIQEECLNCSNN